MDDRVESALLSAEPTGRRIEPVTVVIPTVGRPALLRQALTSIASTDPQPSEVLVIDQGEHGATASVVDEIDLGFVRAVRCDGAGRGRAVNVGLREASHPIVLITDDDCTVECDWIGVATDGMGAVPDGILTGRVLPVGDSPEMVPSTMTLDEARDYTGTIEHGVLFGGNMVCPRDAVLALGGFDSEIVPAAEDCDFCYRWLRSGGRLRHEPALVVHHHDWRSPAELNRRYVEYFKGQGMFYAKHLLAGDRRVLGFVLGDLYRACRALIKGLFWRVPRWTDYRRGAFAGIPQGLWAGWRRARRERLTA